MKIEPRYLKSAVFAACDGIVTTFAVVAGVMGAGLSTKIILILGIGNMVADGLSMAIGDYLGERSGHKLRLKQGINCKATSCVHVADHDLFNGRHLWATSLVTFIAFILSGMLPLIPYLAMLLGIDVAQSSQFGLSIITTGLALFFVGSLRTFVIKGKWFFNGLEMLLIGSIAAVAAYSLGFIVEGFLR